MGDTLKPLKVSFTRGRTTPRLLAVAVFTTLVVTAASGVWSFREQFEVAETRAHDTNRAIARALLGALRDEIRDHLEDSHGVTAGELLVDEHVRRLQAITHQEFAASAIVKMVLFNNRAEIVFSTNPSEIGHKNYPSSNLLLAHAYGEVHSVAHHRRFMALTGLIENVELVESYLPITRTDGLPLGTFEIYSNVTECYDEAMRDALVESLISFFALIGIFAISIVLCARAEAKSILEHDKAVELERRAANAQGASAAKSQILANMSHELRTPLNAIIGFGEIMEVGAFGPIAPPRYQTYVGDIVASARHLFAIIEDALDMAWIDNAAFSVAPLPLPIGPAIEGAILSLSAPAKSRDIRFQVEASQPSTQVLCESDRLVKILRAVLSNAVKYSHPGQTVEVAIDDKLVGFVHVVVRDRGIGIPPERTNEILAPFGIAEHAYARKFGGLGLGLPIAKSFIEAYGGALEIESALGYGTSVHLWFQAAPAVPVVAGGGEVVAA